MEIENILKKFSTMVNNELERCIKKDSKMTLYDAMRYTFSSGGKRLRPVLCLLTCEALGGDLKKAIPFATAIEIIHNASLVHDDIEDGDQVRRNSSTVWVKYGVPQGINVGDCLIFKAYECILNSKKFLPLEHVLRLNEMFTNSLIELVEGQDMEFDFKFRDDVRKEEYSEMAQKKAGSLIGLSLSSGALIAGRVDLQSSLMEYGKKMGLAFQIRDDILNLFGKRIEYGKEIGSDIKEGKSTLMIIDCLNKCQKNEKAKLLKILKKGKKTTRDDIQTVINLIKKYNSKEAAIGYAKKVTDDANDILSKIDNDNLNFLHKVSNFMIERRY